MLLQGRTAAANKFPDGHRSLGTSLMQLSDMERTWPEDVEKEYDAKIVGPTKLIAGLRDDGKAPTSYIADTTTARPFHVLLCSSYANNFDIFFLIVACTHTSYSSGPMLCLPYSSLVNSSVAGLIKCIN